MNPITMELCMSVPPHYSKESLDRSGSVYSFKYKVDEFLEKSGTLSKVTQI